MLGGVGCHSILGIHDSAPLPADAAASGGGGASGASPRRDASADGDAGALGGVTGGREGGMKGGTSGTAGAGGVGPGQDAAVVDGDVPDVPTTGGPDSGEADGLSGTSDGGTDLGQGDGSATDASPTDGTVAEAGSPDGKSDGAALPDAGTCAAPWSATNVAARIFTPSSGGATACSIPGADVPTLAAGVDVTNFRGAAACGACLRVRAVTGAASVVVPVVERSSATGILLTRAAMNQIASGADLINVDWTLVPCDVGSRPVRFFIEAGTNPGFVGVQVRNARYPLAAVSAVGRNVDIPLALKNYNYWESASAGAGPLTLRLTDINGQTLEETGIKLEPQTEIVGEGQLPICH